MHGRSIIPPLHLLRWDSEGGANGYSGGLAPMNPHANLGGGLFTLSTREDVTFRGAPPGPPMI